MQPVNNLIISEARTWLGTKFIPHAKIKNVGCDCGGFVVGVLENIGYKIDDYDSIKYNPIRNGNLIEKTLDKYFKHGGLTTGNIALFQMSKFSQHVAIITDYETAKVNLLNLHEHHKTKDLSKGDVKPINHDDPEHSLPDVSEYHKARDSAEGRSENGFYLGIIHSYIQASGVSEHYFSKDWRKRVKKIYEVLY